MTARNKVLSGIIALLILATISAIVYIVAFPPAGKMFTEFYILGLEGKAEGYPKELVIGQEGRVLLGIENHEYQKISYRVVVRMDGVQNVEIGPVVLEHDEQWEQEVDFTPNNVGEDQEVEFLLYKEGEVEPHDLLHLPLNVKERNQ